MRTIYALILAVCFSAPAFARDVWKSSTTVTASNGLTVLCTADQRSYLHGVCATYGVAASSTNIYNSTFTNVGTLGVGPILTAPGEGCKYFDAVFPKNGMSYYKPNNAAITYLYDCY